MRKIIAIGLAFCGAANMVVGQSCYEKSKRAVIEDFKRKDFNTALLRIENIQKYCTDIPVKNDLNLLKQQAQSKYDSVRFVQFAPAALVKHFNLKEPDDSLKVIATVPLGADRKGVRRFGLVYSYKKDSLLTNPNTDSLKLLKLEKWLTVSVWELAADSFLLTTPATPNIYAVVVPNQTGPLRFKEFDYKTLAFIFHDKKHSILRYKYFEDTKNIKLIQKQYLIIEDLELTVK